MTILNETCIHRIQAPAGCVCMTAWNNEHTVSYSILCNLRRQTDTRFVEKIYNFSSLFLGCHVICFFFFRCLIVLLYTTFSSVLY